MTGGAQVLPFVRLLYSDPSTHVWEDEFGEPQMIPKVRARGSAYAPLV